MPFPRLLAAGFALALASAAVSAQTVRGVQTLEGCADDVDKYCTDVRADDGSVADCMASHRADLSQLCRQAIGDGVPAGQISAAEARRILGAEPRP